MPADNLKEAIKEAYASAPDDVVIIDTIEIRHPAFEAPIRVTTNGVPIQARLEANAPTDAGQVVTFESFPFEFQLPEVIDSGVPELSLKIDNVSREILRNIELAMPEPQVLEVTYRAFLDVDLLGGPQNDPPLHMNITSIEADAMVVTAKASIVDFVNRTFPSQLYDDRRFPGLIFD